MKTKLPFFAAIVFAALFFASCSKDSVSASDVSASVDGPSSIKGTFTGKMIDSTKSFTFNYDYHVTTNDGNSYSESWIEGSDSNYAGDTILYIWQYFYFDRNGYADNGDNETASGKYMALELYIDIKTMKILPDYGYWDPYMEAMFQNINKDGSRFVYYFYNQKFSATPGTFDVTKLAYDKNSQLLSGSLKVDMPDNNTNYNYYGNQNATTITGDFKIYVPKENFQVTKNNSNGGNVYRKRAH